MVVYCYIRLFPGIDEASCIKRAGQFAIDNRLGKIQFVKEPPTVVKVWQQNALGQMISGAREGDLIIVPDLMMFSKSTIQLCEILEAINSRGVWVTALEQNVTITGEKNEFNAGLVTALRILGDYERELVSLRMKQALSAQGSARPGRPKGSGRSMLDPHREEILRLKAEGVRNAAIAERFGTSPQNFSKWLKQHIKPQSGISCHLYCVGEDSEEPARVEHRTLAGAAGMVGALLDYAGRIGLRNYTRDEVMLGPSYIFIADSSLRQGFILNWDQADNPGLEDALIAEGVSALG